MVLLWCVASLLGLFFFGASFSLLVYQLMHRSWGVYLFCLLLHLSRRVELLVLRAFSLHLVKTLVAPSLGPPAFDGQRAALVAPTPSPPPFDGQRAVSLLGESGRFSRRLHPHNGRRPVAVATSTEGSFPIRRLVQL